MKRIAVALIAAAGLFASPAWAEGESQYVMGKFGFMSIDTDDADLLWSIGAMYGYPLDRFLPNLSAEAELNLGLFGGEFDTTKGDQPDDGDYSVWTVAGYGAYRFPLAEKFYAKGKLGLLYENVTRDGRMTERKSQGVGLAGGVGLGGQVVEGLTLEAEITGIDEDILFFSLGVHYALQM